ncbi:fatty-acyl-CoA synthase [Epibacterium ulvae]|uniref:Fatty-acyl-CoA synthase n=1 Tax=Epibacterium ulvae TaxID=1156985 RepID=A0A1G5PWJ7_9RHOB|nr:acyl-CoA synthetase [Epibacterium ulvae]SCZ53903.1 fatty-acyl-CoA synthase [Epibacterium ulvae]
MVAFAQAQDCKLFEQEMPYEARNMPKTLYALLEQTAGRFPNSNASSYQILSGPTDKAETLTWGPLKDRIVQTANLFRTLGIGEKDVVAYVLPNCHETLFTFIGGAIAGIVNPINPLLDPDQIASILRETGAKVVVTLKPFPKTDVPQKVFQAVADAPNVETVLEVDLNRYLSPPKSWIVPFIRPKLDRNALNRITFKDFNTEIARQPTTLAFADSTEDRVACYFHTGGTTGMPKVAQHRYSGLIYNGWIGETLLFKEDDNIMCPLPLFHVFACHVIVMAALASGAHVIFPTPQGYRGDGVFDNFWKLIERWNITFMITVPTAVSALMQRPVDADISSVKIAFSGSAPMPLELFKRFEGLSGINIVEGYGLTEATCLVSCNPVEGEKRVGSIGIPFPYTDVKIITSDTDVPVECGVDQVGEICISSPGVYAGHTYTEEVKNKDLYHQDKYLRTGDLGRLDKDGYLWITGRAKDLIIRGGHNIDPGEIEEALLKHEAVAFAGAIGQPDTYAGELPCAYVELVDGADITSEALRVHCETHVKERAALPKHITILDELPKTAVGKVFKPDLRKEAITRVYNTALEQANLTARVTQVIDDKSRGLVAQVDAAETSNEEISRVLGGFTRPWDVTT